MTLTTAPKCTRCGRFYRWQEPGSSWVFVPDSYVTHEESVEQCARCTEKHGVPLPTQSVSISACSGVYRAGETTGTGGFKP